MSYAVRHEIAEWVRTLTTTYFTAMVVVVALMAGSWAVALAGATLIAGLLYLAYRIDRQKTTDR